MKDKMKIQKDHIFYGMGFLCALSGFWGLQSIYSIGFNTKAIGDIISGIVLFYWVYSSYKWETRANILVTKIRCDKK